MSKGNRLDRRAFIHAAANGALAAGLASKSVFGGPNKISLGCFNRPWNQAPLERALEGIKGAGFRQLGLLRHQGGFLVNPKTASADCRKIGPILDQAGLELAMYYAPVDLELTPEKLVTEHDSLMQGLADLGCKFILLMGTNRKELEPHFVECMRRYADRAAKFGLQAVLKPHGGISATGPLCAKTVEAVGSDNFRICYDPGNIAFYSSLKPSEDVKSVARYVAAMCVKDFRSAPDGKRPEILITPGDGEVDFGSLFGTLKGVGFAGPCIVELLAGKTPEDADREAKRAFQFLRQFI